MRKRKNRATKTPVKQRNKYTLSHRETARKYYIIGLNLQEISKLMDNLPVRTLEKWQIADKWTELKAPQNIKLKAKELHESGKSYTDISEILQISRVTVWRYLKEVRTTNKAENE